MQISFVYCVLCGSGDSSEQKEMDRREDLPTFHDDRSESWLGLLSVGGFTKVHSFVFP